MNIIGVDYGSKMAGTTVLAHLQEEQLTLAQSVKKQDADQFLVEKVTTLQPSHLLLDAPLSLPGVYRGLPDCDNFFYRKSDQAVQAMSPMFLGGLTARAMQLAHQLREQPVEIVEIYPSKLAELLGLKALNYKKRKADLLPVCKKLKAILPFPFTPAAVSNWHQVDAVLALYSGWRFLHNEHETFGNANEGQIVV